MKQLEAHEFPLSDVFSAKYAFRIPNYQRPYAWEPEHAEQLLTDLADFLDEKDDEPYFLGSIVLIKGNSPASEVIDGQQRLTTLTILLAVLRDLTANSQLRQAINELIVQPSDIILGRQEEPRLRLRKSDADFFATRVQTLGSINGLLSLDPTTLKTDSQRAILANARALHSVVSAWDERRVLDLVQLLGQRTVIVVVSTPDLDSAHRIFSVMNARGLDLAPTDIFKSRILGALNGDDKAAEQCVELWEDAEQSLGRDAFVDLFLHIRMIFGKEKAQRSLLNEFQTQVLGRFLPDRAKEFVTDVLVPYADAYEQISTESYVATHGAEEVNAWFRRLSQLDTQDWRPVALWALHRHRQDPDRLDALLRSLERLAASFFIRRVYATSRIRRYAELLRQLESGLGTGAPAFDLSDQERADTLERLDGQVYQATKTRRYVMLRLNEILAPDSGIAFNFPLITVEHVLPQNPAMGSRWLADFTPEERGFWTHRLANLVLLNRKKNAEAQNLDFERKKTTYFAGKSGVAPFPVTIQVVNHGVWTPRVLQQRQQELVGLLAEEWRLAAGGGSPRT